MATNNLNIGKLSSLWARQLHVEFDEICWKYHIRLRAPIFEISNSKKQFGSWREDTRTISISSYLIRNHSWAVTINILKHEVAHQICSELFKSTEVAHGEAFQSACDLLGLAEEYRRASGDLPKALDLAENPPQPSSPERRFIEKVEKLLALAQSSNENEAALAMQKANELIEKHNIRQLSSQRSANYGYVIINKKKKRIASFQRHICTILQDFFYVKIIYSCLYDPLSNQTNKTIEILGSIENIEIAEYCYYFLENQLAALWSQNKHRYNGKTRTEKNSYYLGVLNGFYNKLQNQKQNKPLTSPKSRPPCDIRSLMVAEDARLNAFVAKRFPRLRTLSRRGPQIYKNTFNEGVKTGKKLTLHKGVTQKTGVRGKLLT